MIPLVTRNVEITYFMDRQCAIGKRFLNNSVLYFCFDPEIAPNTPGELGVIDDTYVQSRPLDEPSKQAFPVKLLQVMKRHAEDLLWAKNYDEGRRVLRFVTLITADRDDAADIYKGNFVLLLWRSWI